MVMTSAGAIEIALSNPLKIDDMGAIALSVTVNGERWRAWVIVTEAFGTVDIEVGGITPDAADFDTAWRDRAGLVERALLERFEDVVALVQRPDVVDHRQWVIDHVRDELLAATATATA
jgi:hypothetical protein